MQNQTIIVREPLLDAKQNVLGYRLSWSGQAGNDSSQSADDVELSLIQYVIDAFNDEEDGWLLPSHLLFLETGKDLPVNGVLHLLSPSNVVFVLRGDDLASSSVLERVRELRSLGYGILLTHGESIVGDKQLIEVASHIEIPFSASELASRAKLYGAMKHSTTKMIASGVANWADYDACAALGLDAFVGKLHLTPRPSDAPKGLNPGQAVILQLMEMVRSNADVRELETVFKRDPTITYKLLRFINSAGMRQGAEIQNIRHAVTLLGYAPLYRWLSLLLATASTTGYSPVLMQTAILRGRFAELLGTAFLPSTEAENLFVAGMFSLLDRLLGIPMNELMEKIHLPEQVVDALVNRAGACGPYLSLAEACEVNGALVGSLAASLHIEPDTVNRTHLKALVWMHSIST